MAQPVKVDIGAAVHGHQRAAFDCLALDVALQTGHTEGTRWLGDGARVLVDVLDGRADLVGAHQQHLVHALAGDTERLLAHLLHGNAVGEDPHMVENHPFSGRERVVH